MDNSKIEILSVPYALDRNGNWVLNCYNIELNKSNRESNQMEYPLAQNYFLPIGKTIENGVFDKGKIRETRDYHFTNFKNGKIERLSNLSDEIYDFPVDQNVYEDTYVYSIFIRGRKIVFFTYELFRRFIGFEPSICKYLFEPFMLEMMLDKTESVSIEKEDFIYLQFNELINKNIVDNSLFLNMYVNLFFHEGLKNYWKQLIAKKEKGRNYFIFEEAPFDHFKIKAEFKEYKDFDLVLNIQSMELFENFPKPNFIFSHPKIKEHKPQEGKDPKRGKSKMEIELSRKYDFSKNLGTSENGNNEVNAGQIKPGFTFQNNIKFKKVKRPYDQNDKPSIKKSTYKDFKLRDLVVSFNEETTGENASKPKFSNPAETDSFDLKEIPPGLQEFSSAITILSKELGVGFNYNLIPIKDDSNKSLLKIHESTRYALFVKILDSSNICFLEVDSSDNKYISTLIFKDVPDVVENDFVKGTLQDLAARGGSWDLKKIKKNYRAEKIKHPKFLNRYSKMNPKDAKKIVLYRLAIKLINILTVKD